MRRVLGQWPKQHHQTADQLDAGRTQVCRGFGKKPFALEPRRDRQAHLDQLVRRQGAVDLLHDRCGQPAGSQQHDRLQVMRIRFQLQPLIARQDQFSHGFEE